MNVLYYLLKFNKMYQKEDEKFKSKAEFSQKLSEYRRNRIQVTPFVVIEAQGKPYGDWLKYGEYNKRLKQEKANEEK